jgi:phosphoribosylglycinamide formyltransferase-1
MSSDWSPDSKTRIAVFASGSGSNAEAVIRALAERPAYEATCVFCNRPRAGVIERARRLEVPTVVFGRSMMQPDGPLLPWLRALDIDFLLLLGFLWKIPAHVIKAYPRRVLNLHPALLPAFGGPGMYGSHVHRSVIEHGATESGITLHLADEAYDRGAILYQRRVALENGETVESLEEKIRTLEQAWVPTWVLDYLDRMMAS